MPTNLKTKDFLSSLRMFPKIVADGSKQAKTHLWFPVIPIWMEILSLRPWKFYSRIYTRARLNSGEHKLKTLFRVFFRKPFYLLKTRWIRLRNWFASIEKRAKICSTKCCMTAKRSPHLLKMNYFRLYAKFKSWKTISRVTSN